jgi:hypothetical protein
MKPDPDYEGVGLGPNPEPDPGKCPFCEWDLVVSERLNENSDNFITTFKYSCPECDRTWIDKP